MPSFNVQVSVLDPDRIMAGNSDYAAFAATKIQLYRWTTEALARAGDPANGSLVTTWTLIASTEQATEAAGPFSFKVYDSGWSTSAWYRYRLTDDAIAQTSNFSAPWQAINTARPTLREIMWEVLCLMGNHGEQGTASAGSTTTVTCTPVLQSTLQPDSTFSGHWLMVTKDAAGAAAAPEMEEALIASNVASTGVATLDRTLTAAIASGDQFIISPLIRPTELIRCINRALEGMKIFRTVDIAVYSTEYRYPAPAGVRKRSDIHSVIGITSLGSDTRGEDETGVRYDVRTEGSQTWLYITEQSFNFSIIRVTHELSYRDLEGKLNVMADQTSAPIEWIRAAAAEEVAKQLVRDDPAQPEFQDLLSRMQDELQLATARDGPQTPPRQIRPVGRQLIGPRNF